MKSYKKMKFIIALIIIMIACTIFIQCHVEAANFSVSSSKTSVTVGDTFVVTINGTGLTGKYNITGNSNVTISGDKSPWIENTTYTITCTAKTEGIAKITVTPETVADASTGNDQDLSAKNVSVTVKAKEETPVQPETPTTPETPATKPETPTTPKNPTTPTVTEPKFTNTNKTMYATGDINLRSSWSTSSSATKIIKGTELTVTGTSTEKVNGYVWYRVSYNGATKYVASNLLTSTKPEEKSNNANLKSLTIENQELVPEFSPTTTSYTMKVAKDIAKLEIKAEPEDSKAKVTVQGNDQLKDGDNIITISVSAEDGTVKQYEIKATRLSETKALGLQSLKIKDTNIDTIFKLEKYDYEIEIKEVIKLEIEAIANDEKATVEILGNEDLQEGENLITIIVSSEDGTEKVTYQVKANKVAEVPSIAKQTDIKLYVYIAIGAILLIALIIVIVYTITHRNQEEYEYSDNIGELPEKKEELEKTQEINDVNNNTNKEDQNIEEDQKKEKRARINYSLEKEEIPKRKKGKHF